MKGDFSSRSVNLCTEVHCSKSFWIRHSSKTVFVELALKQIVTEGRQFPSSVALVDYID